MTREEMLEKMQDASIGASKLSMRSENAQKVHRTHRFPRLRRELKKKSKLLVFAELALPFNPESGEEDDTYNSDTKFRPTFSATTTALMLKAKADTDDVLKNALMRRAGKTEWDTSSEEFTKEDWEIFGKYRVPRIFSLPVVHINIPAFTKSDFGRDYELRVEYDDNGEIVGEVPGVLKVDKLFKDKLYEEVTEYQKTIDSGLCKDTEKQQKEAKSTIYRKNPVSSIHPMNSVLAIELPLTNKYELNGEFEYSDFDSKKVQQSIVLQKYGGNFSVAMQKFLDGSYEAFDTHFDFYVLDMGCPTDGDPNTNEGKMLIGKDTTYEKSAFDISSPQIFGDKAESIIAAVREYGDTVEDLESEVRRSLFTPIYTETVESQMYESLSTVLDIENDKYVTQKVLKDNSEVITIAFGAKGIALLDDIECGVSNKNEGELDSDAAKNDAKSYDLSSAEFADDTDVALDSVELA